MTTNELKAWLSGFLDQKTFLSQDDIERIKAKLQETNAPYPSQTYTYTWPRRPYNLRGESDRPVWCPMCGGTSSTMSSS